MALTAALPFRLRYLLAWDHDLCRAVVVVDVRALLGFLRLARIETVCGMDAVARSPSFSASAAR